MASIAKALNSPAAQASIRARAASRARSQIKEAVSKLRARFHGAAPSRIFNPSQRKNLVEAYVLPAGVGAVGALALDMVTPRRLSVGARGDLLKGAVAIGVGVLGQNLTKSQHLRHAAVGAATISLYKLLTRVTNRTAAGTLAGIMDASSDNDLAGLPDESEVSGHEDVAGYVDEMGNVYQLEGSGEELEAIEDQSSQLNSAEQEMLNGIIPGRGAPELFRVVN